MNSIHFIRPEYVGNSPYKNLTTNGLSVFQSNPRYSTFTFMPCPYAHKDLIIKKEFDPDLIELGFYNSPYRCTEKIYAKFLKELDRPFRLCTLGDDLSEESRSMISSNPNLKSSITHTTNSVAFYNSITCFLYAKSKLFIDPWPTTLEEASFLEKEIVIIDQPRFFKDGIDDLMSCIDFSLNILPDFARVTHKNILSNSIEAYYHVLIETLKFNTEILVELTKGADLKTFITRFSEGSYY